MFYLLKKQYSLFFVSPSLSLVSFKAYTHTHLVMFLFNKNLRRRSRIVISRHTHRQTSSVFEFLQLERAVCVCERVSVCVSERGVLTVFNSLVVMTNFVMVVIISARERERPRMR